MALAPGPWQFARTAAGECPDASDIDRLDWAPADVPVTTAQLAPDVTDHDAFDWWFRAPFQADGPAVLRLGGLATVADVFVNGEHVLHSPSMFLAHRLELSALNADNELAVCCRALAPLLAERRKPRARWRTNLVSDGNVRWWRTSLIGRAPGFSPVIPIVGPWRDVSVVSLDAPCLSDLRLRTRVDGGDGVLEVSGSVSAATEVLVGAGGRTATLAVGDDGAFSGELRLSDPARWWPHTHGEPALHDVSVQAAGAELARRRVGFRELAAGPGAGHDVLEDGLDLHVNGVRVFARGALWTRVSEQEIRPTIERARDAGMNMLRIPGTGAYESEAFHDVCDELGVLVWQDFMFANLDYPVVDPDFRELIEQEAAQVCRGLTGHPSLAVLCGNSEIEQQVAMLGLDPDMGRGELFGDLLPAAGRAAGLDAVYVPSAPSGSGLPMRPDRGVSNYFGVGGYRRPVEDARRAAVRFASECLALANVPADDPADRTQGVPRDFGADWDFTDVRDHYLEAVHGVDPVRLLAEDPAAYYELSRLVSGELMAEVFGEWRRAASPCGGGLILWLRDLVPGSGWGLLDHTGAPKPVWHHLRRTLAPLALWSTDEGLGGIALHLANDRPEPLRGELRLALYRNFELLVGEVSEPLEIGPHGSAERNAEEMLGRFVDIAWSYRFGEPQQDAVIATFSADGHAPLQTVRLPAGLPAAQPAAELGLSAERVDEASIVVRSQRLAHAVRVLAPGFEPDDDGFTVEPGGERTVHVAGQAAGATLGHVEIRAANLVGSVEVGLA